MTSHNIGHLAAKGAEIVKEMEPLGGPKNPVVAFGLGLAAGALGVAIYFRSAKDFLVCMGMFVALSVVLPGVGSALGWLFAPVYGAWRAHTSNENGGW